jgi:membrane protease YdiL (CAAX protease family)
MNANLERRQNLLTTTLLAIYLLIRIILIQLLEYFFNPLPPSAVISIQLVMYLLIIALLVQTRNDWETNNIDRFSVLLILFGGILLGLNFSRSIFALFASIIFIAITVWVFFKFHRLNNLSLRINRSDVIFMITGFVSGLLLSLLFSIPAILFPQNGQLNQRMYQWAAILLSFAVNFFFHFSNAAILEEPIYRGFLWGYFRSLRWKNLSILLMTTGIFWLSHINYLDNPPSCFGSLHHLRGCHLGY